MVVSILQSRNRSDLSRPSFTVLKHRRPKKKCRSKITIAVPEEPLEHIFTGPINEIVILKKADIDVVIANMSAGTQQPYEDEGLRLQYVERSLVITKFLGGTSHAMLVPFGMQSCFLAALRQVVETRSV